MRSEELVAGLRDAAAYPHAFEGEVDLVQTHVSWLFFAGPRVLKVKKPVTLPFLDAGTLEQRRHFCHEEVRLNRRLAPDVYLGVAPIARGERGGLVVGVEPAVEYGVLMRRLPAGRMLAALLERGEVDNAVLAALVEVLARFHARASTGAGVDEHGAPDAVGRNALANFEETRAFLDAPLALPRGLHAFLEARARAWLEDHRELLGRRVEAGRIREGHGDLHADNVCYLEEDGGRVVAYDCLEFSPALRCCNVACDLAFLAMDLDLRGYRGFSGYLAHRYAERTDDDALEELLAFYKGYRAMVRAKVACLRAQGAEDDADRDAARDEALAYLGLAASYELGPVLVLTCGLPASGKSWAARAVARPLEAAVFASDVRRKLLHGVALDEHRGDAFEAGLYSREATDRTYASLLEETGAALEEGRSVVVDATFPDRARRAPFVALARRRGVPFLVLLTETDEATARERLERRARDARAVSDATEAVRRAARARFEPPEARPGGELVPRELLRHASGTLGPEALAARVLERLAAHCEPPPAPIGSSPPQAAPPPMDDPLPSRPR